MHMSVPAPPRYIDLPHQNKQRWKELKALYSEFEEIRTPNELVALLERTYRVAGNQHLPHCIEDQDGVNVGSHWPFEGVEIFLEQIASEEENETFFETILPFIATLASSMEELAPQDGLLLCVRQRDAGVFLDRKFIASILASAVLCALPPAPQGVHVRSINFVNFFACFHREETQSTQAAKFRCFIRYFERVHRKWPDLEGRVFYSRQVIPPARLPSLDDWLSCDLPLCPVVIDNKNPIEDSGEHMLQVDFANCFIGGGVLGAGHVQEEIRFCINPELLVSMMFMEAMQDNEAIVIKGVERFSSYSGYGKTFEFTGDYIDKSQRDSSGELYTTVAAIDAKQFKNASKDAQYENTSLLRELNKALVGFYNPDVGCCVIKDTSDLESDPSCVENEELFSSEGELSNAEQSSHVKKLSDAEDSSNEEQLSDTEESIDAKGASLRQRALAREKLQEFSENLVTIAMNNALNDVKIDFSTEGGVNGDILTMIMKKCVHEVFQDMPEKARTYSETLARRSLLPKCMLRKISGTNSPLVPSTPPPSPLVCDLDRTFLHSNGIHPSFVLNKVRSLPAEDAVDSLTVKGFADSLSFSLKSCINLTSSLSSAIASAACSSALMVADTRERFQKHPKKLGSPVKNGEDIISFLSQKVSSASGGDPVTKYSNRVSLSSFAEHLSAVVSSSKVERYGVHRDHINSLNKPINVKQNLSETFEKPGAKHIFNEHFDSSKPRCLEEFAKEFTTSVVALAITFCVSSNEDEIEDGDQGKLHKEGDSSREQEHGGSEKPEGTLQNRKNLCDLVEEYVDDIANSTLSLALVEAAEICTSKASSESSFEDDLETVKQSDLKKMNFQMDTSEDSSSGANVKVFGLGIQEYSEAEDSKMSAFESSQDERDDSEYEISTENTATTASSVVGSLLEAADVLAQKVLFDGMKEASSLMEKVEIGAISEDHEPQPIELGEREAEDCLALCSDVPIETLDSFAANFSRLTVSGSVEIAKAVYQTRMGELMVRPVATGNWGCGVFRGDPELKAVIQWVVASAAECPAMVYHTFGDQRVSQLFQTFRCLLSRDWKVSDVIQGVLRFCSAAREGRDKTGEHDSLLAALCRTTQSSL